MKQAETVVLTCLVSVEHIEPPANNNRTRSAGLANVIQMKWYKENVATRTLSAIDGGNNNGPEYIKTRYHVTPTFELSDTANLTTATTGSSEPSASGFLIKSNSIYYATKLTIRSIERIDSGHFHCTAANRYGAVRKNYSLTVLEPPDKPLDVRAETVTSNAIKLRWQSPYDGNSPITEYIVSYRALTSSALPVTISVSAQYAEMESGGGGGGATLLGQSSKTITYQLADLIPFTSYSIQMKAKNSVGYSAFTDPVTAKTAEERKFNFDLLAFTFLTIILEFHSNSPKRCAHRCEHLAIEHSISQDILASSSLYHQEDQAFDLELCAADHRLLHWISTQW